jgi:hypothetical protein
VARRKAAARGKISIDEAFHKLLPRLGPDGTVELMNAALRDPKRAKLWCNGKKVDPGFFRTHLVVRARLKAKRRWTAEIEATRALEKPVGSYTWKVDSKQIEALPQPELERPWPTVSGSVNWSPQILAPATPPPEPDPTPEPPSSEIDRILEDLPRRPVGRPRKHDWQAIHAEIARRCIDPKTGRVKVPKSDRKLARDMLNWCQDNNKKEPAESEMRDAVRAVCTALRPLQK